MNILEITSLKVLEVVLESNSGFVVLSHAGKLFLNLLVSIPETFLSVYSAFPWCWCVSHHLLQHPVRSLPAGRLQLRRVSLSWNSHPGTVYLQCRCVWTYCTSWASVIKFHWSQLTISLRPCLPSVNLGSNLSAPENQPELPPYSHTLPLHLQPARPLQHLPGNTCTVMSQCDI